MLKNEFVIIIPVFNAPDLVQNAITSVLQQDYDDCGIIIRDDVSTDETSDVIADLIGIDGRRKIKARVQGRDVVYIRNNSKLYACGNTYESVIRYISNPETVVGVVDGDDRLIENRALQKVYDIYRDTDNCLVWSQHQALSLIDTGKTGHSNPLPADNIINTTRSYWSVSHFRTCKAWLFDHIDVADLSDPFTGEPYFSYAGDAALLYPLVELCGNSRSYFLNEVLYLYNDTLPINEANKSMEMVRKYSDYIRGKQRRYSLLSRVVA